MRLLSSEEITTSEKQADLEGQERVRKMREQEHELAISISALRLEAETVRQELAEKVAAYESEAEAKIAELAREVGGLEERKRQALVPIDDLMKQAERRAAEADTLFQEAQSEREDLRRRATVLHDLEREIDIRLRKVEEREAKVVENTVDIGELERKLMSDSEEIDRRKRKLDQEIAATKDDISRKEHELNERIRAIDVAVGEIDKERRHLGRERTAIADAYVALAKAKEQILGKRS